MISYRLSFIFIKNRKIYKEDTYSICMRILRSYTIEMDLVEKLKDTNASELINYLLREYFEKQKITSMSEEELIKFIKIEKLKKEMELLEHGN